MHRIDNATAVPALPVPAAVGPNPNHYFTSGDPGGGIPATIVDDDWANAIQEEISYVIEQAGIVLDKTSRTQLKAAIQRMIDGGDYKPSVKVASTAAINLAAPGANIDGVAMVAGDRFLEKDHGTPALRGIYIWNGAAVAATRAVDFDENAEVTPGAKITVEQGTVNSDTTWMLTTDGVIVVGATALTFTQQNVIADASETVAGKLEIATDAEAQSFTANKAIDGAKLNTAFKGSNQSLSANGYQKLPGGLIFQWGSDTTSRSEGAFVVTLPLTYPNGQLSFVSNVNNSASSTTMEYSVQIRSLSTTQALLFLQGHSGVSGNSTGIWWVSIGY